MREIDWSLQDADHRLCRFSNGCIFEGGEREVSRLITILDSSELLGQESLNVSYVRLLTRKAVVASGHNTFFFSFRPLCWKS